MMRKEKKRKEKKMENKYPAHGKLRKRLFGHFIKKSFKKKYRWENGMDELDNLEIKLYI